ncbi:hypothetical protein [Planctomyces sp. SH-PL62]|uniref:hypothetical protein n=1 Tax=Planctomyces sp. SH-PL62 TaxID=1636152 RepID=UPI00078D2CA9|nr:hypothetical protein [Planctomyces sp. SH-PL62]AMV40147.1 hypothetical protein VT85_22125 [Planctomyces sp. SH-PL62]
MRVKSPRFRIALIAVLSLATGSAVLTWRPRIHVHLAETACNDAVADGKVTSSTWTIRLAP